MLGGERFLRGTPRAIASAKVCIDALGMASSVTMARASRSPAWNAQIELENTTDREAVVLVAGCGPSDEVHVAMLDANQERVDETSRLGRRRAPGMPC